jgi:glucan biosynthesis protein
MSTFLPHSCTSLFDVSIEKQTQFNATFSNRHKSKQKFGLNFLRFGCFKRKTLIHKSNVNQIKCRNENSEKVKENNEQVKLTFCGFRVVPPNEKAKRLSN